jgi:acyl-CoA synthetase (AMP-forming)/AMP-acid ligase II
MTFLPIARRCMPNAPRVKHWVALCDADKLPADSGIPNLQSYEACWRPSRPITPGPSFDENTASSMCYTSGTTGNPKAALYSHRSTILHAYAAALPDVMCLSCARCHPAGGAHVPCECLGHSVFGRADRSQAGVSRPGAWTASRCMN